MKDPFEEINDVFDVVPSQPSNVVELKKNPKPINDKEDDYELARDTLIGLIRKNDNVIDNLIHLAVNSESARPYEVAGQLLKVQSEIAKGLMDLHKQKKDVDGESSSKIQQQNNIVFAGSTNDLMKLLNDNKTK